MCGSTPTSPPPTKARQAARDVGAKGLCLAGGVAANSLLRERALDACVEDGLRAFLPSRQFCTDNAAMVAAAAWWRLQTHGPTGLDEGAHRNLRVVGGGSPPAGVTGRAARARPGC